MTRPQRQAVAAETIFDGATVHHHAAVLIEGDRIAWLGPQAELPADVPVRTFPTGTWLAPGFIDVQVNGGGDVLFNDDPSPAGAVRIAAAHRRFGTIGLLPTLISDTPEKMRAALDAVRQVPTGSGVLGVHLEGPFLSPERPGAHDPAMIRRPTARDLELILSSAPKTTLVTLAPEEVPAGFVSSLTRAGIRVALGHSMATYAEARTALTEGVTGFTHLFNAMRPLGSREPGPIAAALETSHVFFGMIADGAHVHSAMLRLALRGLARPMLVTDAMPPVGGRSQTFTLDGRQIEARGAACFLQDGTLAGTALDMATAVRNCVRLLDVPLPEALTFATAHPAKFMGLDNEVGHLAPGYRADMVAIDASDIRVLGTWLGGAWADSDTAA
jgi:N-acetylglucosamine-6-phosphate deacetylase